MVLADCILDANTALDALAIYKDKPPDWSKPETRFDLAQCWKFYRGKIPARGAELIDRAEQMIRRTRHGFRGEKISF